MLVRVPKGKSFRSFLERVEACDPALKWVESKSLRTAWRTCKNGAWMLWLAGEAEVDRRLIALATCDCARTVVSAENPPLLYAIEITVTWANGLATLGQVKKASRAAFDWSDATASYAADSASDPWLAYMALDVAADTVQGVAYHNAIVDRSGLEDAAKASFVARDELLAKFADLVRARISYDVVAEAVAKLKPSRSSHAGMPF